MSVYKETYLQFPPENDHISHLQNKNIILQYFTVVRKKMGIVLCGNGVPTVFLPFQYTKMASWKITYFFG